MCRLLERSSTIPVSRDSFERAEGNGCKQGNPFPVKSTPVGITAAEANERHLIQPQGQVPKGLEIEEREETSVIQSLQQETKTQ